MRFTLTYLRIRNGRHRHALPEFVLSDDPNIVSRRTDLIDMSMCSSNDWDTDDPYESLLASSFIWKDPLEAFAIRKPNVDFTSTTELISTQKHDKETLRILSVNSDG